jgi:hypothetical protein
LSAKNPTPTEKGIHDEWTGKHATFNYDAFDNLIKAEYREGNQEQEIKELFLLLVRKENH